VGRQWKIEDHFVGTGRHDLALGFHLAPHLHVEGSGTKATISDDKGRAISVEAEGVDSDWVVDTAFASLRYGQREPSQILKWNVTVQLPFQCGILVSCSG
jgi:hypothetical protein